MNEAKLQGTRLTCKNQVCFYTPTMNKKGKLKQFYLQSTVITITSFEDGLLEFKAQLPLLTGKSGNYLIILQFSCLICINGNKAQPTL